MEESNKKNPFKIPEGYFDKLTDGLLEKLSEEKLVLPEEDGFAVPESYFDELHKNIQQKLDSEETRIVQLYPYRKYYIGAASVAAVLLLFYGLNWNTTEEFAFDDLANADIEAYFETNEMGLSTYEIAEEIAIDELEIFDILENELSEEDVVDYLDDNIENIEDLNLEDYE